MVSCLFRESRKYGIGLVAIDQTPSEIPNSIFANMNAKISFSLGTNQDITSMAKAMNLDRDRSRFLGMLNTGQAIVNVKQRHHDSFLINTPFVREDENVWDEELRSAMKEVSKDSHLNPSDIMERSSPHLPQDKDTSPPLLSKPNITGLEMCLLSDISEHQFNGVDARSKRLGLHPPDGHFKVPHLWPGQNTPPENRFYLLARKRIKFSDIGLKDPYFFPFSSRLFLFVCGQPGGRFL